MHGAANTALIPQKRVHGDKVSTFNATTVLAMLNWLGVKPSYSRLRVSGESAYVESMFRTVTYRPEFPAKGLANLDDTHSWAAHFVQQYNIESAQRHSLRQPGAVPCGRGSRDSGGTSRLVDNCSKTQPGTLVRHHAGSAPNQCRAP